MRSAVTIAVGIAVTLGGCSSRPREFTPTLNPVATDQAAFDKDYAECGHLLVEGKLDSSGRAASAGFGAATGAGVAVAGGALAGSTIPAAGVALASATVVLLPFAVIGGAWGMARMKRARKEKAIKTAMAGCLAERGYQVTNWVKADNKPGAKGPPLSAAANAATR